MWQPTSSDHAVIVWKSPVAAKVDISFEVIHRQAGGSGADVYVDLNSSATPLLSGSVGSANGASSGVLATNLSVSVGDTIRFVMDAKANGSGDISEIRATVAISPPPKGTVVILR